MDISSLSRLTFKNTLCYRLIPSKFPPIYLFEDVANFEDFEILYEVQRVTNPRIQDEIGQINLVPDAEKLFGVAGAGYVMAAFTHINPDGSRFSNGDYGIYYAAKELDTAIAETVYHREKFCRFTNEPAQEIDMRCLVAKFDATLHDIAVPAYKDNPIYHQDDYTAGQFLGAAIRESKHDGIVYNSVRIDKGTNFALFKPNLISECKQASHYGYIWDGKKITTIYQKVVTAAVSSCSKGL